MSNRTLPVILGRHQEQLLRGLSLGESAERLVWLTDFLAQSVGVDYCFVGELVGDDWHRVRTASIHQNGVQGPGFSYELETTPCAEVLDGAPGLVPRDVTQLFPDDQLAIDMGLEGYCGVPLVIGSQVIGILVVCCTRPLTDPEGTLQALEWLAPATGRALEQMRHQARLDAMLSVVRDSSGKSANFWAERAARLLGLRGAVTIATTDGERQLLLIAPHD